MLVCDYYSLYSLLELGYPTLIYASVSNSCVDHNKRRKNKRKMAAILALIVLGLSPRRLKPTACRLCRRLERRDFIDPAGSDRRHRAGRPGDAAPCRNQPTLELHAAERWDQRLLEQLAVGRTLYFRAVSRGTALSMNPNQEEQMQMLERMAAMEPLDPSIRETLDRYLGSGEPRDLELLVSWWRENFLKTSVVMNNADIPKEALMRAHAGLLRDLADIEERRIQAPSVREREFAGRWAEEFGHILDQVKERISSMQ